MRHKEALLGIRSSVTLRIYSQAVYDHASCPYGNTVKDLPLEAWNWMVFLIEWPHTKLAAAAGIQVEIFCGCYLSEGVL